jgi:hypothetical protein
VLQNDLACGKIGGLEGGRLADVRVLDRGRHRSRTSDSCSVRSRPACSWFVAVTITSLVSVSSIGLVRSATTRLTAT